MTANNVPQDLAERVRRLEARERDLSLPRTAALNKRDLLDCRALTKVQDGQTDVYDSATGTWVPVDMPSGGGGGARFASVVVAPADALPASLAAADYVLTGVNDHTMLNTALATLNSWPNGRLVVLEGWVRPGGPINVPAGVLVQGMNRHNGTYISPDASWAGAAIFSLAGEGGGLCDLHINGGAPSAAANGINISNQKVRISNVFVLGTFVRFISMTGQLNTVEGCYLSGAGVAGTSFGIHSAGTDGNRIIGNRIDSVGTGIHSAGSYEHITGNVVVTPLRNGIVLTGAKPQVRGNRVRDASQETTNTYDGIQVNGADRALVTDNTVEGPPSGTRPRYGIRVQAGSTDTTVAHNDVKGAGQTGAYSDAGTTTLTLGGNRT